MKYVINDQIVLSRPLRVLWQHIFRHLQNGRASKDMPGIQFTAKFCSRHVLADGLNRAELRYAKSHRNTRCNTCNIGLDGDGLPGVTRPRCNS